MRILAAIVFVSILGAASNGYAIDDKNAKALAKDNDCTKCHSVSKEKDGPPYKKTAEKYRGNADAEAILLKHLTTTPTVKIDGKEEKHTAIKGSPEEVQNLIQWILSQ